MPEQYMREMLDFMLDPEGPIKEYSPGEAPDGLTHYLEGNRLPLRYGIEGLTGQDFFGRLYRTCRSDGDFVAYNSPIFQFNYGRRGRPWRDDEVTPQRVDPARDCMLFWMSLDDLKEPAEAGRIIPYYFSLREGNNDSEVRIWLPYSEDPNNPFDEGEDKPYIEFTPKTKVGHITPFMDVEGLGEGKLVVSLGEKKVLVDLLQSSG